MNRAQAPTSHPPPLAMRFNSSKFDQVVGHRLLRMNQQDAADFLRLMPVIREVCEEMLKGPEWSRKRPHPPSGNSGNQTATTSRQAEKKTGHSGNGPAKGNEAAKAEKVQVKLDKILIIGDNAIDDVFTLDKMKNVKVHKLGGNFALSAIEDTLDKYSPDEYQMVFIILGLTPSEKEVQATITAATYKADFVRVAACSAYEGIPEYMTLPDDAAERKQIGSKMLRDARLAGCVPTVTVWRAKKIAAKKQVQKEKAADKEAAKENESDLN
ncbi:hypothetical protein AAVH_30880 [Aphelenchoides avenae]|nr:hypothetical protein AAVH_30880 [Aphelenchus avenae]